MAGPDDQNSQYQHADVPDELISYSGNPERNIIKIEAVRHDGAYDAGAEMQQKALAALSILSEDPETNAEIRTAIDRGYFMVLDDYYGGADSEASGVLPLMSVVHDYSSRNLLTDDHGHETAASHVYIGRHEIRHINQPDELGGLNKLAFGPLDSLKATFFSEADAQAEAVMFSFSDGDGDNKARIRAEMAHPEYVFSQATQNAIEYDESKLVHWSDETYNANIRAEAFLGWMSPQNDLSRKSVQAYVEKELEGYGRVLGGIKEMEEGLGSALEQYMQDPDSISQEEIVGAIDRLNGVMKSTVGIGYTDLPLGTQVREMDMETLSLLGEREFSDNYFTERMGTHGPEFEALVTADAAYLQERMGIEIDQGQLDQLSALREEVALLHEANMALIEPMLANAAPDEPVVHHGNDDVSAPSVEP